MLNSLNELNSLNSFYTSFDSAISQLFPFGTPGFWADVALGTMWQDVARTIPVTANNDPVGSWKLNTAAGPIYAEQTTAGQRPLFQTNGNLNWLTFDGVDDGLETPGTLNFSATDKVFMSAGIRKASDAAIGAVVAFGGVVATTNGAAQMRAPASAGTATFKILSNNASTLYQTNSPASYAAPLTLVASGTNDNAASMMKVRANGAVVTTNNGAQLAGNYGTYTVSIGRQTAASVFFGGNIYGMIMRGGPLPTDAQILQAERWLATKTGLVF